MLASLEGGIWDEPAEAKAITDGRPNNKTEDLMKVKGIERDIFEKIKDHITVN